MTTIINLSDYEKLVVDCINRGKLQEHSNSLLGKRHHFIIRYKQTLEYLSRLEVIILFNGEYTINSDSSIYIKNFKPLKYYNNQ
jgi:hypothetical protein